MLLRFIEEQSKINDFHHTLMLHGIQDKIQQFNEESDYYSDEEEEEEESELGDEVLSSSKIDDTGDNTDVNSPIISDRVEPPVQTPPVEKVEAPKYTDQQKAAMLARKKTLASSAMRSVLGGKGAASRFGRSGRKSAGDKAKKSGAKDITK